MRTTRNLLLAVLFMFAMGVGAPAMATTTLFADNFDSENGGVGEQNYNRFLNWTVWSGSAVDLDPVAHGKQDSLRDTAEGLYVDLAASKSGGVMQLNKLLSLQPGRYLLEFDLAGSPQSPSGTSEVRITLGRASAIIYQERLAVNSTDPWTHYLREFEVSTPTKVGLYLFGEGEAHQGPLIDNLRLTQTPFPPTLATTGVGFLALFLLGRRFGRPRETAR